jgi:monomeric sarcosine oxidase
MSRPTVLVVGGGVMGVATGAALASRGAEVTVLERYSLAHDWASSHGLSRAIRHEYGPAAIYTEMVTRSLALWDELARETGRHLYTETGVLTLGQPNDGHTLPGYEVMRAAGLPIERLTSEECAARFPQFCAAEFGAITYNASGGMLAASECVRALAIRLQARGGTLREGVHVVRVEPAGTGGHVILADGTTLEADRVVITAGPWIHDVLHDLLLPIQATQAQVIYLAGLPKESFAVGRFPTFLADMSYYGFPLHGSNWFKVAWHGRGADANPNDPYPPDMAQVEDIRAFLRRIIPSAAEGELALVDRCMYDMSPDEDFILDRHPGDPGVIIGSGFSGHGFKFGVLIGELLAALALDAAPEFPLDRFRLDRFSIATTSR